MANNNTPKNPLFDQYKREYQRLQLVFKRQEKKGYVIPKELKPRHYNFYDMGEDSLPLTLSDILDLINLTPAEVRRRSYYRNPNTGELTYGLDVVKSKHKAKPSVRKLNKSDKVNKGVQPEFIKYSVDGEIPPIESNLNTDIIDRISALFEDWTPAPYWNTTWLQRKTSFYVTLYSEWSNALHSEGAYQLANRMENKAEYFNHLIDRILHASDDTVEDTANVNEIIQFLLGRTLTAEESDMYTEQAGDYIRDAIMGDSFG